MLSHLDENGNPRMVDVSGKEATRRTARARAVVALPEAIVKLFRDGDIRSKKGPVFQTAIIAGVMAAKKTSELIPLCHPIALEDCAIEITLDGAEVIIEARAVTTQKTGVEMEALVAANVAALTVYDMCKGVSHDITMKEIRLLEKTGGKSGYRV